jgi:hypothetical protein
LPTVFFKIVFGASREVILPWPAPVRMFESLCGVFKVEAVVRRRLEAAPPSPLVDIDRDAVPNCNRADMDITVIDVPAVLAFGVKAAGEFGHDAH